MHPMVRGSDGSFRTALTLPGCSLELRFARAALLDLQRRFPCPDYRFVMDGPIRTVDGPRFHLACLTGFVPPAPLVAAWLEEPGSRWRA